MRASSIASFLVAFAASLLIFALCAGEAHLWSEDGRFIFRTFERACLFFTVILLGGLTMVRFETKKLHLSLSGFCCGLLLLFVSDWMNRPYSFFPGPSIRGEILLFALVAVFILPQLSSRHWQLLAAGASILCIACFFYETGGRLLISDDHSSFIFRLSLLKDNFPSIPFYYPFWNGGIDARDFFATGSLNFFFLFSPLIYSLDLLTSYNFLVALLLFVLFPLSTYFAARIEKFSHTSAAIASIVALSGSLYWYRWALKYGTLGFITTAVLLPVNLAWISRLLDPSRAVSLKEVLLFSFTCTLMLLWPPCGIILLPCFLVGLIYCRSLLKKQHVILFICLMTAANLPWMVTLWSVSKVSNFLKAEQASHGVSYQEIKDLSKGEIADSSLQQKPVFKQRPAAYRHRAGGVDLNKSLKYIGETALATSPLVLMLCWPGFFLLSRPSRRVYLPTFAWLLFLGSIAVPIKPQLELDRMLILFTVCASLPCAQALEAIFMKARQGVSLPAFFCFGFLMAGVFQTGGVLLKRSLEHYHTMDDTMAGLAGVIKAEGGDGRSLFAGCIVHQLSNGHLAPLTVITQKPIMASSPLHTLWRYTQIVPKSFLERGDKGIEEYFNTYNVSSVIAYEREWREYLQSRPDLYKEIWRGDVFIMFKRLVSPHSWFVKGQGQLLSQTANAVKVRVDSPSATLSFNYFPFLKASSCLIGQDQIAPEVSLIKLEGCSPGSEVIIDSVPLLQRLLIGRAEK